MSRILFVGAEHTITEMTGKLLKRNGFDVQEESVYEGIQFCQKIRQCSTATKFLLISGNEKDEEAALLGGADDWLKKPYSMRILYARIRALLRQ